MSVLVTGATGVVGSSVVPEILARTDHDVIVVIRGKKGASPSQRLEELRGFWRRHQPAWSGALEERVRAVEGDTARPDLGLASGDAHEVRKVCTHVVHAAAEVRMNLTLERARESAVAGVEHVLAFAARCPHLRKVEMVSTVGVGGRRPGPLPETWISGPRQFHNTYEQAKAEAEDRIEAAVQEGFPATVHRPSMIIGDSRTGAIVHFQIFYYICEFLSGKRTMGLFPRLGRATLDVIACDHVARGIVAALTDASTVGGVLHHCAGPRDAMPLVALRALVQQRFREAGRIHLRRPNLDVSSARILRAHDAMAPYLPASARKVLSTLPLYLDYLASNQTFANDATKSWLEGRGIVTPSALGTVQVALDYYLARGGGS